MKPMSYRIMEHTADTGFEVTAETRKKLFEAAALAFFDLMWSADRTEATRTETIDVTGGDIKELMVNFLEEFLYLYDAKGLLCTGLEVESVTGSRVSARALLQRFDAERDRELLGVKAVTYHQLEVGRKGRWWRARVFLDI